MLVLVRMRCFLCYCHWLPMDSIVVPRFLLTFRCGCALRLCFGSWLLQRFRLGFVRFMFIATHRALNFHSLLETNQSCAGFIHVNNGATLLKSYLEQRANM